MSFDIEQLVANLNNATPLEDRQSNINDINGTNLIDYLIQQREAGAVPSFSNIPGAGGAQDLDTFVLPPPTPTGSDLYTKDQVRLRQLQELIDMDDTLRNPMQTNDYAVARDKYDQLELAYNDSVRRLRESRGQELGIKDLEQRLSTLTSMPGKQYMAGTINSLIDQYNGKRVELDQFMNSPDTLAEMEHAKVLLRKWKDRKEELKDKQLRIDNARIDTDMAFERNERVAEDSLGSTADVAKLQQITGESKDALVEMAKQKSPRLEAAKIRLEVEKRIERESNIGDFFGTIGGIVEEEIVDTFLDKMPKQDADAYRQNVIAVARHNTASMKATLSEELYQEELRKELEIQNRGRKADKQKGIEDLSIEDRDKVRNRIPKEALEEKLATAAQRSYAQALNTYKRSLVAEAFREGMSLKGNSRYSLEAQEASEQLIRDYPDAFNYPVGGTEAEGERFKQQWRKIGASYNGAIPLDALVQSMVTNTVIHLNSTNGKKLPDGELVVNSKDPALFAIYRAIVAGKRDTAVQQTDITNAATVGPLGNSAVMQLILNMSAAGNPLDSAIQSPADMLAVKAARAIAAAQQERQDNDTFR